MLFGIGHFVVPNIFLIKMTYPYVQNMRDFAFITGNPKDPKEIREHYWKPFIRQLIEREVGGKVPLGQLSD